MKNILQKIFSIKNTADKTHKVVTIFGIKFKLKRNHSVKFCRKEMENIISQIDKNKQNYLYLDWFSGKYIFDRMIEAKYQNINLIKFSLFNLFGFLNRFDLWGKWNSNNDYIQKKLTKYLKDKNIRALLVTLDWAHCFDSIINIFKNIGIPTYCIIHEGVFQDENIYYNSQKPISDKVLTWGELTKQIFEKRGYPTEKIFLVGSIKLNSYKYFKPKLSKNEFFEITGLDENKKTILYCCQLCDFQWGDQDHALKKQKEVIEDLGYIAKNNNYNLIIRNAPAHPSKILPVNFVKQYENIKYIFIDGVDIDNSMKSVYKTNPDDAIFYSDIIIGMNTTMQLEASVLNKPSIVAKYFDFYDKWHQELGLPVCRNKDELELNIKKYIEYKKSLIIPEAKEDFYKNYGYYPDMDFDPLKNIEKVLLN